MNIILTQEGKAKLEAELKDLIDNKRPEVRERIKVARDMGDLRENAEYHQAKDDQAFIEGRILELESMLNQATISDGHQNKSTVSIGSKIEVEVNNQIREYSIVGSTEADPIKGLISCDSPLGEALLNKKVNDSVTVNTPKGLVSYTIKKIN